MTYKMLINATQLYEAVAMSLYNIIYTKGACNRSTYIVQPKVCNFATLSIIGRIQPYVYHYICFMLYMHTTELCIIGFLFPAAWLHTYVIGLASTKPNMV